MTTDSARTALPVEDVLTDPEVEPYWEAARLGRLVLPNCKACGHTFWYPRGFCPCCGAHAVDWTAHRGTGEIYSFTVVHRSGGAWRTVTPYVIAYVSLDSGPTVVSNIVECAPEAVFIGQRVTAVFQNRDDGGHPVLRFTPVVEGEEQPNSARESHEEGGQQ